MGICPPLVQLENHALIQHQGAHYEFTHTASTQCGFYITYKHNWGFKGAPGRLVGFMRSFQVPSLHCMQLQINVNWNSCPTVSPCNVSNILDSLVSKSLQSVNKYFIPFQKNFFYSWDSFSLLFDFQS